MKCEFRCGNKPFDRTINYTVLICFLVFGCVRCEDDFDAAETTPSPRLLVYSEGVSGINSTAENEIPVFPLSTTQETTTTTTHESQIYVETPEQQPALINLSHENQPEYITLHQHQEEPKHIIHDPRLNSKNIRLIKFLRHFRLDFAKFDTTCLRRSGRGTPAPHVAHAHVSKYTRRRNRNGPRNRYAMALYDCDEAYEFPAESADRMFCSRNKWVGPTPVCLPKRTLHESECIKCEQICSFDSNNSSNPVICSCYSGYEMIEDVCSDIDECEVNNGGCFGACFNKPGSFLCTCPPGYSLGPDGKGCIDKNECLLRNGHGPCQDKCTNVPGSYICGCDRIGGTRLAEDKHSCEDINECVENDNFGCSHTCLNTFGNAFCSCPKDYILSTDDYKTCLREGQDGESDEQYLGPQNLIDVDPLLATGPECPPGSSPDTENSRVCVEHEDCGIDNGGCEHICATSESYRICSCKEGFKLINETSCADLNECDQENGGCDQICINIPGSYFCTCKNGFSLENDKRSCKAKYCEDARIVPNTSGWECEAPDNERMATIGGSNNDSTHVVGTKCKLRCLPGYTMGGLDEDVPNNNIHHHQLRQHRRRSHYNTNRFLSITKSSVNDIEAWNTIDGRGVSSRIENNNRIIVCTDDGSWSPPERLFKSPCSIASCSKLSHPKNGSLFPDICLHDNIPLNTQCLILCSPGFYPKNGRIRTCSKGLRWFPEDNPLCIRLPPTPRPYIHCPSDVIVDLKSGQSSLYVKIPQPQANMDWYRYVEADPPWAKSLEWNVPAGITQVTFTARSPVSNDTATCQFKIHVVDREPPRVQGCPSSFEVRLNSGESSREVWWSEPKFSDNVKLHYVQTTHSPGQLLSRGMYHVTYLAGDAEGNKVRCAFTVTIHAGIEDYEMSDYSYYNGNGHNAHGNDIEDSNSYQRQLVICPNLKTGRWSLQYAHYLPPGCRYHSQNHFSQMFKQTTFQRLTSSRLRRKTRARRHQRKRNSRIEKESSTGKI